MPLQKFQSILIHPNLIELPNLIEITEQFIETAQQFFLQFSQHTPKNPCRVVRDNYHGNFVDST
jgi:hypothetical protein